jgi:lysine/ornithine N-monooxygenase
MCFLILKISKTKLQPSDLKEVNLKNPTDEHDFKFVNYINENDLNII